MPAHVLRSAAYATALLLALGTPSPAVPEPTPARTALVIGNSAYREVPLKNPVNDARAIARALERLGFRVSMLVDGDRAAMQKAIVGFAGSLDDRTTGLFYYAGHGVQSRGRNYLLPVDAVLESEAALRFEAIDVAALLEEMGLARSKVNFVILDACRNNPFERRFRGASRGLAAIDAASGTLIAYATAPGSVASDGEGENGLYTAELLRALEEPGLKAEDVFKRVRIAVAAKSKGVQVPWESSSLTGDFIFNATAPAPQQASATSATAAQADARAETAFWESVRDSGSVATHEEYLLRFPQGMFAGLARIRLEELRGKGAACTDLSGAWRSLEPGTLCPQSTLHLEKSGDSGYAMRQEGCLGATGSAHLRGSVLTIDWSVPLCRGRTEVELGPDCRAGKGEVVMPANLLVCSGRHPTTIERLPRAEPLRQGGRQ